MQYLVWKNSLILICLLVFLSSCNHEWKETESGLRYRIIKTSTLGPASATGSVVKIHLRKKVNDTIVYNSDQHMPHYVPLIPGTIFPGDPFEILFENVHAGDSIIIEKQDAQQKDLIVTQIKVLNVFPFQLGNSDTLVTNDKKAEWIRLTAKRAATSTTYIESYLCENNLMAGKTDFNTYLQIKKAGTGPKIQPGKKIILKFKVHPLPNYDPTTDTTSYRQLEVVAGADQLPESIDNSIQQLAEGTHAHIYIPAMLTVSPQSIPQSDATLNDILLDVIIESVEEE